MLTRLLTIILIVNSLFGKEIVITKYLNPKLESNITQTIKNLTNENYILKKKLTSLQEENNKLKIALAKMIINLKKDKQILNNMYYVNNIIVNVRSCPDIKCRILITKKQGDIVLVTNKVGKWYQIKGGGFIYYSLLSKIGIK